MQVFIFSWHIVILKVIIIDLIYINVILLYTASQQLFLINSFLLFSFMIDFIFFIENICYKNELLSLKSVH